ncbi:MAG: hypothetical protein MMC33_001994 [Icmadophila ericetorum]|nr:hypothetical protein [Icmadophila ericetorum]
MDETQTEGGNGRGEFDPIFDGQTIYGGFSDPLPPATKQAPKRDSGWPIKTWCLHDLVSPKFAYESSSVFQQYVESPQTYISSTILSLEYTACLSQDCYDAHDTIFTPSSFA